MGKRGRKAKLPNGLDVQMTRDYISSGANSITELWEFMTVFEDIPEMSPEGFSKYFRKIKSELEEVDVVSGWEGLPEGFGKRGRKKGQINRPQHEKLVQLINDHPEYTQTQYAQRLGVTRSAINQKFIKYTELRKLRGDFRLERKEVIGDFLRDIDLGQRLVDTLAAGMVAKAYAEDDSSAKKASESVLNFLKNKDPRKKWKNRFCVLYENIKGKKETGKWPSQSEVAKKYGIFQTLVSKYLFEAGFTARQHKVFDGSELEKAIVRGYEGGLSPATLVNFLELPNSAESLYNSLKNRGIGQSSGNLNFYFGPKGIVPLHKVTEFYEAQSLGQEIEGRFSLEECAEYAEVSVRNAKKLTDRRDECVSVIVEALQKLFDEPRHNVPYVTRYLREKLNGWKGEV